STALTRGMKGLAVRIARTLNRLWNRKGRVFDERFHMRQLRTPRQVRNVLVYVLQNARKHGRWHRRRFDRYSSGFWFEGWAEGPPRRPGGPVPVAAPRSWVLCTGWRRLGSIAMDERPSAGRRTKRCAARSAKRRTRMVVVRYLPRHPCPAETAG